MKITGFKQGAYIFKNNKELRNKLEELGYQKSKFSNDTGTCIATYPFYREDCIEEVHPTYIILNPNNFTGTYNWIGQRINCEEDEDMFLKIVSEKNIKLQKMKKFLFVIISCLILCSCNNAKYQYKFMTENDSIVHTGTVIMHETENPKIRIHIEQQFIDNKVINVYHVYTYGHGDGYRVYTSTSPVLPLTIKQIENEN